MIQSYFKACLEFKAGAGITYVKPPWSTLCEISQNK